MTGVIIALVITIVLLQQSDYKHDCLNPNTLLKHE